MARLTRTQKYAELRDRVSQDREESLKTNELSQYEDKLRNLESFLNRESETDLNKRVVEPTPIVTSIPEVKPVEPTPVVTPVQEVKPVEPTPAVTPTLEVKPVEPTPYVAPVQETRPVQEPTPVVAPVQETVQVTNTEVKKAEEESMKSLEDILTEMMNVNFEPKKEEVVTPVQEVKPVEPTPVVTPIPEVKPIVEPTPVATPVTEVKPVNEPVDIMSTMEIITNEVEEISEIIGEQEVKPVHEPTPVVAPITEIKPEPITPIEIKSETTSNSFIADTLDEVNKYNLNAGRDTLETLSESLANDVRQIQDVAEEKVEDLDFSNTVSLEIEKVLSEIGNENNTIEPIIETPVIEPVEEAELESEEAFNNAEVKEETFEHPVLAKTIEEPVVEIKNINDTLTSTASDVNVLDDTIPFVVDREEDEEDEDDEEEAPSKALNVILGILIFVLIAVLGVIVYYILVAKGIIG